MWFKSDFEKLPTTCLGWDRGHHGASCSNHKSHSYLSRSYPSCLSWSFQLSTPLFHCRRSGPHWRRNQTSGGWKFCRFNFQIFKKCNKPSKTIEGMSWRDLATGLQLLGRAWQDDCCDCCLHVFFIICLSVFFCSLRRLIRAWLLNWLL